MTLLLLFANTPTQFPARTPQPGDTPAFVITGPISGLTPISRRRFQDILAAQEAARLAELRAREIEKQKQRDAVLAAIREAQEAIADIAARDAESAVHDARLSELTASLNALKPATLAASMRSADEIFATAEAIRRQLEQEDQDEAIARLLLSWSNHH